MSYCQCSGKSTTGHGSYIAMSIGPARGPYVRSSSLVLHFCWGLADDKQGLEIVRGMVHSETVKDDMKILIIPGNSYVAPFALVCYNR